MHTRLHSPVAGISRIAVIISLLAIAFIAAAALFAHEKYNSGIKGRGGIIVTVSVKNDASLAQTAEVLRMRLDRLGARSYNVKRIDSRRLAIVLPGIESDELADFRGYLTRPGFVEFRLVHPQNDQLIAAIDSGRMMIPPGYVLCEAPERRDGKLAMAKMLIDAAVGLDGKYVSRSYPTCDKQGHGLAVKLTSEGAKLFGQLTSKHIGDRLAITLDGKIQSAPVIREAIWGGKLSITGNLTESEAQTIAAALDNPLPDTVIIEKEETVAPLR